MKTKKPLNTKKLKNFLFEMDVVSTQPIQKLEQGSTEQPQNISVDQKIDHFLMQYEKESMPASTAEPIQQQDNMTQPPQQDGQNLSERKLFKFMFEADEPEEDPLNAGGGGDSPMPDFGGGDSGGGDEQKPEDAQTSSNNPKNMPKINLTTFSGRLARLINNYETLLDPKTTLLNRAKVYISKNYNQKVAEELMTIMSTQFGITALTNSDKEEAYPAAPFGGNAGDGGGTAG